MGFPVIVVEISFLAHVAIALYIAIVRIRFLGTLSQERTVLDILPEMVRSTLLDISELTGPTDKNRGFYDKPIFRAFDPSF